MNLKQIEDKLIKLSLMLFLTFEVFAGPLRWIFNSIGAEVLFSLPKLFILITQIVVFFNVLYSRKISVNGLISAVVLVYIFLVSFINIDISAFFVGFWGILPIFLGYNAARIVHDHITNHKPSFFVVLLFIFACISVVMNIFIEYPWYDVTYNIAGMDVSSAQMGTTGGYLRYAGFFKTSLQASASVLILLLYLVMSLRNIFVIFVFFIMSAAVSIITISKTVFALHLVLIIYLFVKNLPVKLLWRGTLLFTVLITVFTISSTNYVFTLDDDPVSVMLLGSLDTRLTNTWPAGVKAILYNGNLFFGGGMGTLGVGSKLSEYGYNPGDSMYLYIVATGGYLLALILLAWGYYQSLDLNKAPFSKFISMVFIIICLFGISMTTPEYPIMALSFGMLFNARISKQFKVKNLSLLNQRTN